MAIEGYIEANGEDQNKPMTKNELKNLMERYPD